MELQRWSWIHGWLFSVYLFVCRPPLLSTHRSISLRVHVGPPHPPVFLDPRVGAWSRRWPCYPMLQHWRMTWWIVRPGRRLLPLSSLQHSAPVRWIDRLSYTVRATAFNSQYNQQVLICFYFLIHISHICEVVWPFPLSSCGLILFRAVHHWGVPPANLTGPGPGFLSEDEDCPELWRAGLHLPQLASSLRAPRSVFVHHSC